jgi:hypothetical protein
MPDGLHVRVAGAGHLLPDQRPADVTAALRALLAA